MHKALITLMLLSLGTMAQADIIHLRVTTHIQDGVHFPELNQCFLSASEPRAVVGEDVILDMHTLANGHAVGSWEKHNVVDGNRMTYRLHAMRAPKAGAPLRIRAHILINGVVENTGLLDLAGDEQWGFPVNFLEATTVGPRNGCQTANITVVPREAADHGMAIALGGR